MEPVRRSPQARLLALALLIVAAAVPAQDANVTRPVDELEQLLLAEPLRIEHAEISRPKAKGDITLKADVSFGGSAPLHVKLRKAAPGADSFNNVPRYDLAAYELQKLFVDPPEYLVPPTVLRFLPLADLRPYSPDVERTFAATDQVLTVMQYWLQDVTALPDVYTPARFESDAVYARHVGQLNVLTCLIRHRDSNLGNFLIGRAAQGPRLFSIDHGVAFASADADRGELWKDLRVTRLPADTVARLRLITPATLESQLAVVAQWRLQDGQFVPAPRGPNLAPRRGVRRAGDQLQMGLTRMELQSVAQQLARLLQRIDRGEITTFDGASR